MSNLPKNLTKNEASGCIMARIMRNKEQHARNFSLVEYGSWKKAEKAAVEWLAKIKKTLPPPITSRGVKTSRNSSGVVGVSLKAAPLASGRRLRRWWLRPGARDAGCGCALSGLRVVRVMPGGLGLSDGANR